MAHPVNSSTYFGRGEQLVCDVEASSILPLQPLRANFRPVFYQQNGGAKDAAAPFGSFPRLYHWYSNRSTSSFVAGGEKKEKNGKKSLCSLEGGGHRRRRRKQAASFDRTNRPSLILSSPSGPIRTPNRKFFFSAAARMRRRRSRMGNKGSFCERDALSLGGRHNAETVLSE